MTYYKCKAETKWLDNGIASHLDLAIPILVSSILKGMHESIGIGIYQVS
jgi:hypothetical protein